MSRPRSSRPGAHLIPTPAVVAGFGPLSKGNRLVIAQEWIQEWIAEGVTMLFLGALVALVTTLGAPSSSIVRGVYGLTAALVTLGVLLALPHWTVCLMEGGAHGYDLTPHVA
jgi:hypothetical protein